VPCSFDYFGFVRRGRFESRFERVGFAGEVTFAFIFDRAQPAGATLDIACLGEFDIRTTVPQPVYPQSRKCDEVLFLLPRRKINSKHRMSDLLYYYASGAKTSLLRIMPRQYEPFGFVGDAISGDGWVVGDLLDKEGGGC